MEGFGHGELCENYEKQANEQGFTLGEKAGAFENIKESYDTLMFYHLLTPSQADAVCEKIQEQLVKNLKPLGGRERGRTIVR